jgi:glycosyltransferase involved in cell wall biosynthesis
MLNGKKIVVVMPAYNVAKTIQKTYDEMPHNIVDEVILVDDGSVDETARISREIGIKTFIHSKNMGYGANQKTCYREALKLGADVVIMLHPDYQYNPRLITAMCSLITEGVYDVVLGSRILGNGAIKGGMPIYKYISNRILTLIENLLLRQKISEYHTGYRSFSKEVLKALPLLENSNDFIFDNQMLTQVFFNDFTIGEISCPTRYNDDASSINFARSIRYGVGVLYTSVQYALARWMKIPIRIFCKSGKKIVLD